MPPKKKQDPALKTAALTNKLMKQLSTYYGLAILRNKDSVEGMRKAIWAIYYHKISTDSKPQHNDCPSDEDSWCKYNKCADKSKYKHQPPLSEEAQEILEPIFQDLTQDELLERCLGGLTQNNNESFNSCVWSITPKHIFSGGKIVEIATHIAACVFNEGFDPILKIMEVMNIKIGPIALEYARSRDNLRIRKANRESSESSKEARTKRKDVKSLENEMYEENEGILYGAGIAD